MEANVLQWIRNKQTALHPYHEGLAITMGNKKKLLIHATTWIYLKGMILSKRNWFQKATYL